MHPCPCHRCLTDNAPTYVTLGVAAYPPSHSPRRRRCRLPAIAFTSSSLSPPTVQLIFSRQRTSAPPLLLQSQPICSRRCIAFAFRKLPPSPLPAQLIFSRRRTLPPSSPLPSQIICSRRRTHTATAVAFMSLLSSPPTAQLFFSCRCPHIVSTVPFTCGHPVASVEVLSPTICHRRLRRAEPSCNDTFIGFGSRWGTFNSVSIA